MAQPPLVKKSFLYRPCPPKLALYLFGLLRINVFRKFKVIWK
jgi:hypothetical protein